MSGTGGCRPRVVYWGSQPSPYVVERLNAVSDRSTIDLEAWFDYERESDRAWRVDPAGWRFPWRYLDAGGKPRVPLAELKTTRPDVLVTLYDRPHTFLGIVLGRSLVGRLAIRCLPPVEVQAGHRTLAHRAARRLVFATIDGAKVSGPAAADFAVSEGLPRARTWPVTQSVDLARYGRAVELRRSGARDVLRERFACAGCTFVYVGRLVEEKGVFDLLDAFASMLRAGYEATLVIAGVGSDEERIRAAAAPVANVRFVGFLQADELPELFAACDCLVLPTHGDPHGLVVQEGLAAGLAVVCSDAAEDIGERIEDGTTGYVYPVKDVDALAGRLQNLAANPERTADMGRAAAESSARFDHQHYGEDFEAFVTALIAAPPRRNPLVAGTRLLSAVVSALTSFRPWRRAPGS